MVLGIYGAGGSAKDLFSLIKEENREKKWEDIIFIDDTKAEGTMMGKKMMPFKIFSEMYSPERAGIIIAVGEPEHRQMIYERIRELNYKLETYIHRSVKVSEFAEIADGVVLLNDSFVSPMVKIGTNVWVNGYTIIGHDVQIGNHCQISSQVIITGNTVVDDCVYVGAGASIRERITIGRFSIVSMGAVVLKPVKEEMIVMGNPARPIAVNEKHRVF